ncbi:hypothetical protein [Nonomuraea indica]|uniref:hypothetical protein n=1 Tax=Nonomuraea indica TaxID=1581193 RepID=UPI001183B300|nr:hypothetical protein [Nonomuraea indica]
MPPRGRDGCLGVSRRRDRAERDEPHQAGVGATARRRPSGPSGPTARAAFSIAPRGSEDRAWG